MAETLIDSPHWEKILEFDLDKPASEYGFSTRLAHENYWTLDFTERAIVEYKKFMYLAGTQDVMVSPSEIVDIVWHQHLIFTQSYNEFCQLIGKQIQHIPSTHNASQAEKFKAAKERTFTMYQQHFGKQPADIWNYKDMFASLHLQKAKLKIRTFLLVGIAATLLTSIPLYFLLHPVYLDIDNPYFLFGFSGLVVASVIILEIINSVYLKKVFTQFNPESFIFRLNPLELVYLKSNQLSKVIHGFVNQLIKEQKIRVDNKSLQLVETAAPENPREFAALSFFEKTKSITYQGLLFILERKAAFLNYSGSMDALKKYINKSKTFGRLFYLNFAVIAVLFNLGLIRFVMGVSRDKPVIFLGVILVVFVFLSSLHLNRLIELFGKKIMIDYYKQQAPEKEDYRRTWEWEYFLTGKTLFVASFIPLVILTEHRNTNADSSHTGNSCGSSCGSSCGGGCGGCGGS